jgi:4-amino-4-deoxy-L-arabinose transferase-like glycosyltransferase
MGREPASTKMPAWCPAAVTASALLGLALMADQAHRLSATYDEVTYLRVAARWWRTGEQSEITRMGSPLTFWKLQQAPTLWALDRLGHRDWIDDPIAHQAELLPVVRLGGLWIWLVALLVVAGWARRLYGPRAMAMASAVFALEPNLLAHGALATMELPVVACTAGMFLGFWSFLRSGSARAFWATAALGGLAMSCKFTTALVPPILGMVWAIDLWRGPAGGGPGSTDDRPGALRRSAGVLRVVVPGMLGFLLAMVAANLVVTGLARIPLSANGGLHPLLEGRFSPGLRAWAGRVFEASFPQDWVGFATQVVHQRNGGPSYLLGERRLNGWAHYYPVSLGVKVPLAFWLLIAARARPWAVDRPGKGDRSWALPVIVLTFVVAAILGSKRNYGVRYLLPVAAPAIVWASGLAEGGRGARRIAAVGLAGMAASLALTHPHELSYFNTAAGGPIGGRRILSDSNLDWGQGAKALARLQRDRPELVDLTLYYFGDTDPGHYGVQGHRYVFDANRTPSDLPGELRPATKFVAVSASLQWGPWGPPGYFRELDPIEPECYTDDTTIAIYRTARLGSPGAIGTDRPIRTGRGPG